MNPSKNIPEGVETVEAEGSDVARAIAAAAETMGVEPRRVEFKYDLSHFRSSLGTSVARSTVKIIAWRSTRPEEDEEPASEVPQKAETKSKKKKKKKSRKRTGAEGEERAARSEEAPEVEKSTTDDDDLRETEASTFAHGWFTVLLEQMGIEGEVRSAGNDERVQLWIKADKAGRLIGKRGSTLGAIRHLLGLAVEKKFGKLTIDVDVADNRPSSDEDRKEKGRRKKRSRDRKRGPTERHRYPEAKLKALARRAAERALESDKTITINLELNSYDRRIIHLEVAAIDGVSSRSEERDDGVKVVQVFPDAS